MSIMQRTLSIPSPQKEALYDITADVQTVISDSGIQTGICSVYAQGATAGIMIQENWDDSVQRDVIDLLGRLIPNGVWRHDAQDGNGDSHLKSGIVGPGESVPVTAGRLGLSRWQNIFFCEFDGPRRQRSVVVTLYGE